MADFDLDNFDMDLSDIEGADIADMDLSSFGEVDDTIEFPHFKVSSKSIMEFMKVAKNICSSGGRDIVSKAVCLIAQGDKVICRSTDFDVYIEQSISLLNDVNILEDAIIIPTDVFMKLLKAVPSNTLIYKKENDFYIRLYGGDIVLESYKMEVDKFVFSDKVNQVGTVDAKDLYSVMKDFSSVVTGAVSPAERRIISVGNKAYASYLWAILEASKSIPDMDLKVKDISVLKTLTGTCEESLKVYITDDSVKVKRCVIEGPTFKYAFLLSDVTISNSMRESIGDVIEKNGVYVDFLQLYKTVEVAADLPYSIGKVGINYSDSGIVLALKTKKNKDSIFNIEGSIEGNFEPLGSELIVQAKLLKIILRSFASKSSVRVSVNQKGIGILSDDYKAVIYSEET